MYAKEVNIGHGVHFILKGISSQPPTTHKHGGIKDAHTITKAPSCLIEVIDAAR